MMKDAKMQSEPCECKICGMITVNPKELAIHMQAVHVNKKMQCQSCGRIFDTRDDFSMHALSTHSETAPFQHDLNFGKEYRHEKETDDTESALLRKMDREDESRKRTRGPYRKSSIA